MVINGNKNPQKSPNNNLFICDICDIICNHKGDWNKHALTAKHINNQQMVTNGNKNPQKSPKIPKNPQINNNFNCECGKDYKYISGLSRHKKICTFICIHSINPINPINPIMDLSNNIIMELIKQNQEFKNLLIEQNKHIIDLSNKTNKKYKNINNITNNTNNFNLHFFLNEKCKDALNIEEFVNQIKLQISDLDMIGKVGYVEGITKIFLKNLKLLDICKRPIHCSDLKRETLYVKDKDAWEKENNENVKIKNAIKQIEDKNVDQIPQWMNENPAYNDYESNKHMEYHHILIESMGGSSNDDNDKNKNKIVRNISKEVFIDKKNL